MSKKLKYCKACETTKIINEFHKGQAYCIECRKLKQQKTIENRQNKIILVLVENSKIEKEYIEAARLLFDSCASRFNDCNKNSGYYFENNIACDFESIEEFFIECLEIEGFWTAWKKQSLVFEETKQDSDRPTIDRINEKGNYSKDNIQMLSKQDNVKKAASKPSQAILIKNHKIVSIVEFDSKAVFVEKMKEHFPISVVKAIQFDTGTFQQIDDTYTILIQSQNIDKNEIGKDITEPQYKIAYHNRVRYITDLESGEEFSLSLPNQYLLAKRVSFNISNNDIVQMQVQ